MANWLQDNVLKPVLIDAEAALEANKSAVLAAASEAGHTAEMALTELVLKTLSKQPMLAIAMPFVQGSIKGAMDKLLALGLSESDILFNALVALMKHEIALL